MAMAQRAGEPFGALQATQRISSLEKKPAKGGIPQSARLASRKVMKVRGIFFASPPIWRISSTPCRAWITAPAPKNRQALKNAWVVRWNMPTLKAPSPQAMNM